MKALIEKLIASKGTLGQVRTEREREKVWKLKKSGDLKRRENDSRYKSALNNSVWGLMDNKSILWFIACGLMAKRKKYRERETKRQKERQREGQTARKKVKRQNEAIK